MVVEMQEKQRFSRCGAHHDAGTAPVGCYPSMMIRTVFLGLAAALVALAGCATEDPQPVSDVPTPPAWVEAPRPAPGAGRAAAAPAVDAAELPPDATATPERPATAWRVVRDGALGCAERTSLRLLRQGEESVPRLLAEARVSGGCRTTFRVNEWELLEADGDLVNMRLVNGPELTLWFLRSDLVAP